MPDSIKNSGAVAPAAVVEGILPDPASASSASQNSAKARSKAASKAERKDAGKVHIDEAGRQRVADHAWARAYGLPPLAGALRASYEDFCVREQLRFEPVQESEDGRAPPHWLLKVEKSGLDTATVLQQLSERLGCKLRDIGYSGLKDKFAVCEQWLSVPGSVASANIQALSEWQDISRNNQQALWRVLEFHANRRKLGHGSHRSNSFVIRVRNVFGRDSNTTDAGEAMAALEAGASMIRGQGFPNYFGEQRFGYHGRNLINALSALRSHRKLSRSKRSLYTSVLRSFLFNEILHHRVQDNSWLAACAGDSLVLDGSKSFFRMTGAESASEREDINARLARGDLHIGGTMAGHADSKSQAPGSIERVVLDNYPGIVDTLVQQGVKPGVRPLRVVPRDLGLQRDGNNVVLAFTLPAGSFATALLRELFRYRDVSREARHLPHNAAVRQGAA